MEERWRWQPTSAWNLTVTLKKGRAVLWPSVLDKSPNIRYATITGSDSPEWGQDGANAWIHQRDYRTPNKGLSVGLKSRGACASANTMTTKSIPHSSS
jgi:hypothetical protein